jgi:hypothetical protein
MRFIFTILCFFSMLIFTQSQINSQKNLSNVHRRLASLYCFIDDYPAWLERQTALHFFLEFAQLINIDTDSIEQEIEQYRLQRECLRVLERLPILIGSG